MAHIYEEVVEVTTTGGDGAATGSGISGELVGYLESIFIDYHASAPATTDVTIAFTTRGGNIVVVTDSNTDVLLAPVKQACDAAAAAISGAYLYHLLNQPLTITVAGCNALTAAVTVYIRYIIA